LANISPEQVPGIDQPRKLLTESPRHIRQVQKAKNFQHRRGRRLDGAPLTFPMLPIRATFTERTTMSTKASSKSAAMTSQAAARIQSSAAKGNSGHVNAGTFAARAQRAVAVNQGAAKGSK
jgi:hypothetical protein